MSFEGRQMRFAGGPTGQLVILTTFLFLFYAPRMVDSGCANVGRCCQGKDNNCVGYPDRHQNSIEEGHGYLYGNRTSKKKCFCDSACLNLGDCCYDYRQNCPSVDCVLADEWQAWTDCSARCGRGTRQRARRVIRAPLNGGRPCNATVQKGICYGTRCKQARAHGHVEMRETAKLLPASFGTWRKNKLYNPYKDIRKNLFEKNNNGVQSPLERPSYCAVYELTDVKSSCWKTSSSGRPLYWTGTMSKGIEVCAECQPTAMRTTLGGRCQGAGLHRRETRWMALNVPGCHGAWRMKTRQRACRCDSGHALNLILV